MREVLRFVVGQFEQHWVQVYYDSTWGSFRITIDGQTAVDELQIVSVTTVLHWEFVVGTQERHNVRVEKERPALFPALRPHTVRGYINGVLVATAST